MSFVYLLFLFCFNQFLIRITDINMDPGCVDANMDKTPLKTIYVVQTKSLNVLSRDMQVVYETH